MKPFTHVSVHGGHSRQFCFHADNTLEEIVNRYFESGYAWVGITEHMPPPDDTFLYPDQIEAGMDARGLLELFEDYVKECRRLQNVFADRMTVLVGFETETIPGYETWIPNLIRTYRPDYIVGSVHHVDGFPFDFSQEDYQKAVNASGGMEAFYRRYFDLQHQMIHRLKPSVVGHFDLVRIFDPDYREHLLIPGVWERIVRNLKLVKGLDLILDYNLRALAKGADEPYVSAEILRLASEMSIKVVPGDDSHGIKDIGRFMEQAVNRLVMAGFDTQWPLPETLENGGACS